jgi:hypothetical protein
VQRTLQAWQIYFMTVKKMSANVAKASKKSRLSVSCLLPRIAIYTVVAAIIASFYDFQLGTLSILSLRAPKAQRYIVLPYISMINQAQQAYYAEHGQFSDSIAKLGLGLKVQTDNHVHTDSHNYTIGSSMGPVQTLQNQREPAQFESAIAIAKPNDMSTGESYTYLLSKKRVAI